MNKADLEWYNNLPDMGDTIYYKGSDGSIDTFLISNKFRKYRDCNSFEVSNFQHEVMGITGDCLNKKVKNTSNNYFQIEITKKTKTNTTENAIVNFTIFDITANLNHKNNFKTGKIKSKYLNKEIEIFTFNAHQMDYSSSYSPIRIENFYWSKDYGLIKYTTNDSITYEYLKKSH